MMRLFFRTAGSKLFPAFFKEIPKSICIWNIHNPSHHVPGSNTCHTVSHLLLLDILLKWSNKRYMICSNLKRQSFQLEQALRLSLSLLSSERLQAYIPWLTAPEIRLQSSFWRHRARISSLMGFNGSSLRILITGRQGRTSPFINRETFQKLLPL